MARAARLLVLVAAAAVAVWADSSVSSVDEDAAAKIAQFTKDSAHGLATLTDRNFDYLARGENRPYHTFVLLNARAPQYNCAQCGEFEDEVEVLAQSYWRMHENGKADGVPIFFARAEYGQNTNVFRGYNLQSVPLLVYYAPTGHGKSHSDSAFPAGARYASELDAENAALFVREKTDLKVEIYRNPLPRLLVLLFLLAALGGGSYAMRHSLLEIAAWVQRQRLLWMLAAASVYLIAVSGFLYDIIRGVPNFGFDPAKRSLILFSNQSGMQYGVEGFIIGFMNLGAGAAVILLTRVLPKMGASEKRNLLALGACVSFYFLFTMVWSLYTYKNNWYRPVRLTSSANY